MKISWKNKNNLKPNVILDKIDSIKTVSSEGNVSFSGFELHEAMPVLKSMISFPGQSDGLDKDALVWKTISSIPEKLTPDAVINKINEIYRLQNAVRESVFHILTSVSLNTLLLQKTITIEGDKIRLQNADFPKKYSARHDAIRNSRLSIDATPRNYSRVIIVVKAKSPHTAVTKALRCLDLQRALWCLFSNSRMEIIGNEWEPINTIRLGGIHTVHNEDGSLASEMVWFEPNYTEAKPCNPKQPEIFKKNCTYACRLLSKSKYSKSIKDALLRYVRALDEKDQNNALIKLWGAIECLTSPGEANYDFVTKRCSFIFEDNTYHKQVLEHLREVRNQSVHAGDQEEKAKINCYQLQFYFYHLIFFYLRSATVFNSLDEANQFLSMSPNKDDLLKKKKLLVRALRFVSAKPANK